MFRTSLSIAIVLAATGCAPALNPTAQRDVLTHHVRPELARIIRQGDPIAAIAIAGLPPDESLPFVSSYEVVKNLSDRLAKLGIVATGDAGPDGFRLVVELEEASAGETAARTFSVFNALARDGAIAYVAPPSFETLPSVDPILRCSGRAFVTQVERDWLAHPSPSRISAWATSARDSGRTAIGVVGTRATVDAVTSAWTQDPPWLTGSVRRQAEPQFAAQRSAKETTLSLPVRGHGAAGVIARSLASDATSSMIEAAGGTLHAVSAHGVTGGECMIVRFSAPDAAASRIGQYVASEVAFRAGASPTEDVLSFAKRESDPRKAAAIAAWRLVVQRTYNDEKSEPQSATTDVRESLETGQQEFHLVLASSCPLASEVRKEWGLVAIAIHAAVLEAREREPSTNIEPWLEMGRAGLYLHGTPRADIPGVIYASNLVGVAARALWGVAPSRGNVERGLRWTQTQTNSQHALLLGALAESALPAQPSAVTAFGRDGFGASFDDVVSTQRGWRSSPFSIAILNNDGPGYGSAARKAIARYQALFDRAPSASCKAPEPQETTGTQRIAGAPGQGATWITFRVPNAHRAQARLLAAVLSESGSPSALHESQAGAWLINEVAPGSDLATNSLLMRLVQIAKGPSDFDAARRALSLQSIAPRQRLVHLLDETHATTDAEVRALAAMLHDAKPLILTLRAEDRIR